MAAKSRASLFEEDDAGSLTRSTSDTLFNDDDDDRSPWDMPTPRKQQTRAELLRSLLAGVQVPDSYVRAFDSALAQDRTGGRTVTPGGIAKILAAAKLDADHQVRIMSILAPSGGDVSLGRDEFNVLLALIALAQEGEPMSLDSVDERRRSKCLPTLSRRLSVSRLPSSLLLFPLIVQPEGWIASVGQFPSRAESCRTERLHRSFVGLWSCGDAVR